MRAWEYDRRRTKELDKDAGQGWHDMGKVCWELVTIYTPHEKDYTVAIFKRPLLNRGET